jgi:hypothetical protein
MLDPDASCVPVRVRAGAYWVKKILGTRARCAQLC